MSIVQMVKPGLRETRTSQLAELGCVSRCLFVGLNHTKTKISPQETGCSAAEGCTGFSSDVLLHLDLQLRALVPRDHCEHLVWLQEGSKHQVVKTTVWLLFLVISVTSFCREGILSLCLKKFSRLV